MCFENNTDISGVGVRVSFYLQTFFLGLCAIYHLLHSTLTMLVRLPSLTCRPILARCSSSPMDIHIDELWVDDSGCYTGKVQTIVAIPSSASCESSLVSFYSKDVVSR
jgi:hypothetical protein